MKILDANRSGLTVIGRQGENRRTAVRFPVSAEVFEEYPEATVQVLHQRFGDPAAYPVHEDEYRVDSDGVVVWTVLSGDTAKCGRGQCELVFSEGDVVVLTIIYATHVLPSLSAGKEPPEPWESWTGEISRSRDAAAASAEEAAKQAGLADKSAESAARSAIAARENRDEIAGMSARAETLAAGSEATARYEGGVLTIGVPKGADGATFTPNVSQDGILSWTNDGGKENPEEVDLMAMFRNSKYAFVTGENPLIEAEIGRSYKCMNSVESVTIECMGFGDIDVTFRTLATGGRVSAEHIMWPEGFDPEHLKPNTVYKIILSDVYASVMSWTI